MSQSQDPIWWQTANRKWALHGQNYPTEQMKVSRENVWTLIFWLCVLSSLSDETYVLKIV